VGVVGPACRCGGRVNGSLRCLSGPRGSAGWVGGARCWVLRARACLRVGWCAGRLAGGRLLVGRCWLVALLENCIVGASIFVCSYGLWSRW